MKHLLKLMRVKHYIKNILVFIPLVFMGGKINLNAVVNSILGFIAFCLICSCIYIVNDARDVKKDRLHPTKCNRPMASGAISVKTGIVFAVLCFIVSASLVFYLCFYHSIRTFAIFWLGLYFFINLAYSFGLKNIPIVDIIILMSGFLIRILFGAAIANTFVSTWLYLTVMSGAFYFALGKRRNEIKKTNETGETRKVLSAYSHEFLDKFMYVSLAMAIVFYALWAKEYPKRYMILTVPLVVIICMQYSLDVEGDSDGDPVEVLVKDKKLIVFCLIYMITMAFILFVL